MCGVGTRRQRKGAEGRVDGMFQGREGSRGEWGSDVRATRMLAEGVWLLSFPCEQWAEPTSGGRSDLYFGKMIVTGQGRREQNERLAKER